MPYNPNMSQKEAFKSYMKTQIRYIKLLSYTLKLNELKVIEIHGQIFRNKYNKKHNLNNEIRNF